MMKLIKSVLIGALISITTLSQAQHVTDSQVVRNITEQILVHGKSYEDLRTLTKQIGHRLSGSEAEKKAITWAQNTLRAAGADSVWLQPVMVPKWIRGKERLLLLNGKKTLKIQMLSLGNSEGTGGKKMQGKVICFETMEALQNANPDFVKDNIVFLNFPFPAHFPCTFDGYSIVGGNRYNGPAIASKKGAKAFIIRSLSTGIDAYDLPHTGVMSYSDAKNKIPAVAISNKDADTLCNWIKNNENTAAVIQSECGMQGEVLSYNVIGELKGNSNNIITVGGHLDSWDVGEGAHDDGAGCVQSIEVLRTFKSLNLKPKNTLRIVLFANEENGAKGGKAYADSAFNKNEKHIFALESDAGGFSPRGFSLTVDALLKNKMLTWSPYFLPLGIYDFEKEGGGVDIDPLQRKLKTPVAGLLPDTQRYFDVHHCEKDVFENVNKRELQLGAAAMTTLIYLIDKHL